MKAWPLVGILLMQAFLLAAHWFLYGTWIAFWGPMSESATFALQLALLTLGLSFVSAALLGFYSAHWTVTLLYRVASAWLGFLNYLFWAACLCWLTGFALHLARLPVPRPAIAVALNALAIVVSVYGLINVHWIRQRRIPITLAGLPESWRGRTAMLMSDLHLGHINGPFFCRRMVEMATRLTPDVIFIPGDLYDGSMADAERLGAPLSKLTAPLGVYFST